MTDTIETTARENREAPPEGQTGWEALCAEGPNSIYPLTAELDILNAHPYHDRDTEIMFRDVAATYRKIHMRYLCQLRQPSAHKLIGAIVARTLDFRKYAEKISYDQFQNGVRGRDGNLSRDDDGIPIFAGTDLSRSTIVKGLGVLVKSRTIERFAYQRGTTVVYAYMPFTRNFLLSFMVKWVKDHFQDERNEARRTEHLETIAGMFGFLKKRWPMDDSRPRKGDPDVFQFILGKGVRPTYLGEDDQ